MKDPTFNHFIKKLQNSLGAGTKYNKGRWYVCPCCLHPGKSSKSRSSFYKAAKKSSKKHEIKQEKESW